MESIGLFDYPVGAPLASRMRPRELKEFFGQSHLQSNSVLLGEFSALDAPPSLILYGPPGTGKTSLARILAKSSQRRFIEISAVNSSVTDLRQAFAISMEDIESGKKPALLFIDEIHRFNKGQQDSILKHVEDGTIILLGATTENPRFSLTNALLSRTLQIELAILEVAEIVKILNAALEDERGLGGVFLCNEETIGYIAKISGGDARKALSILETASVSANREGRKEILLSDVAMHLQSAFVRYDATGDNHYDVISAFIKSIRGSDADAALHYLARMIHGGEDPRFIARRLVILAAEDIGLADPNALNLASSTLNIVSTIGMPEGRIPLAELAIYLALAPKSNSAYIAINRALDDVEGGFAPEIPVYLRSTPPQATNEAYIYPHDLQEKIADQALTGQPLENYYEPGSLGLEKILQERLEIINRIRAKKDN